MRFSFRFPYLALFVVLALTALAGWWGLQVKIEVGVDQLYDGHSESARYYQKLQEHFTIHDYGLVYAEPATAAKRDVLQDIERSLNALGFIEQTHSPYTRTVLTKGPTGLQKQTIDRGGPDSIKQWYYGPAEKGVAIFLQTTTGPERSLSSSEIIHKINSVLRPHKHQFERLFYVSPLLFNVQITNYLRFDLRWLIPVALLGLVLVFYGFLRLRYQLLIPVLTSGLSIIWLMGAMSYFLLPINIGTGLVLVILITIGATEDVHILSEFRTQYEGYDRRGAVYKTVHAMDGITALTFLTTTIGFATIAFSGVTMLRQVAFASVLGLLSNYLITIMLHPPLLTLLPDYGPGHPFVFSPGYVFDRLRHYRQNVLGALLVLIFLVGAGSWFLTINTNGAGFLPADAPAQKRMRYLNEHWGGYYQYYVVLDGHRGYFATTGGLAQIETTQDLLKKQQLFSQTLSLHDHVQTTNRAFSDSETLSDDLIAQYFLLNNPTEFVTADRSMAIIYARSTTNSMASKTVLPAFEQVTTRANEAGKATVRPTGALYLTAYSARMINQGQFIAIIGLLSVVLIVTFVRYRSLYWALVMAGFNGAPIAVFYGLAGWSGIELDAVSAVLGTVILGIAIDDSLHMLQRLQYESASAALSRELPPVAATTTMVSMVFLLFAFSSLPPLRKLAVLMPPAMATAMLFDLLLPVMARQNNRPDNPGS